MMTSVYIAALGIEDLWFQPCYYYKLSLSCCVSYSVVFQYTQFGLFFAIQTLAWSNIWQEMCILLGAFLIVVFLPRAVQLVRPIIHFVVEGPPVLTVYGGWRGHSYVLRRSINLNSKPMMHCKLSIEWIYSEPNAKWNKLEKQQERRFRRWWHGILKKIWCGFLEPLDSSLRGTSKPRCTSRVAAVVNVAHAKAATETACPVIGIWESHSTFNSWEGF